MEIIITFSSCWASSTDKFSSSSSFATSVVSDEHSNLDLIFFSRLFLCLTLMLTRRINVLCKTKYLVTCKYTATYWIFHVIYTHNHIFIFIWSIKNTQSCTFLVFLQRIDGVSYSIWGYFFANVAPSALYIFLLYRVLSTAH